MTNCQGACCDGPDVNLVVEEHLWDGDEDEATCECGLPITYSENGAWHAEAPYEFLCPGTEYTFAPRLHAPCPAQ